MENIRNEKAVCEYLNIPSIPKKTWDGKKSFKHGVAIVKHNDNDFSYAIATYDSEVDEKPHVIKVFNIIPFRHIEEIFIVPNYMDVDGIDGWDLDEKSKKVAKDIVQEAKDIEGVEESKESTLPNNEYCFDFIHNDEEALAYIRAYNKKNGIKTRKMQLTHDDILTKLTIMWLGENSKKNKKD